MSSLILGTETGYVRDIDASLDIAKSTGQDFIIVPLFHPRSRRDARGTDIRPGPRTRSDMVLRSSEWVSNVVGRVSEVSSFR